jgi:hypothetical protein
VSEDAEAAQWAAQELLEQRRFEEEQEALRADPAYIEWLAYIEATTSQRTEMNSYELERI